MTLVRLLAVPVFCALLISSDPEHDRLAGFVFVAAAFTDMLDGQIARRMRIMSSFGQALDPIADRLLVGSAVVILSLTDPRLPVWMFALFLGRDVISGIWFALVHKQVRPKVSMLGKVSTATLMLALTALLLTTADWPVFVLWIGVGMALMALLDYILRYERYLPESARRSNAGSGATRPEANDS